MTRPICWIITEGAAGMENQCRGLSDALGLEPVMKRVNPRAPWLMLPGGRWPFVFRSLGRGSDRLTPPWPDIVISCGRKSVPFSLAIKQASHSKAFTVHIQDPLIDPRAFDLVAAPEHDRVAGPNVVATRGALHPVTKTKLAAAAVHFREQFAHLGRPYVAVLIGGPNGRYRFDAQVMAGIADRLAALSRRYSASLLVTPSRRTGEANEAVMRDRLKGVPAYIWDRTGENPYLGLLALADYVVVTADSVSMATEACATGKPVYVFELDGRSRRQTRFHDDLAAGGITRSFDGTLESWTYEPVNDTERVAAEVRRLLNGCEAAKIGT